MLFLAISYRDEFKKAKITSPGCHVNTMHSLQTTVGYPLVVVLGRVPLLIFTKNYCQNIQSVSDKLEEHFSSE